MREASWVHVDHVGYRGCALATFASRSTAAIRSRRSTSHGVELYAPTQAALERDFGSVEAALAAGAETRRRHARPRGLLWPHGQRRVRRSAPRLSPSRQHARRRRRLPRRAARVPRPRLRAPRGARVGERLRGALVPRRSTAARRSRRSRRRRVTHRIAVIAGDGAGPEVVAEARKAVDALGLDARVDRAAVGHAPLPRDGAMMPRGCARHRARLRRRCCSGPSATRRFPTTSRSGGSCSRSARGSTSGRTSARRGCSTACPRRSPARRGRHAVRPREHRGRVLRRRRPRARGPASRGRDRDGRLHARRRRARRRSTRSSSPRTRRGVVTSATKSNASRYGYVLWDEVVERGRGRASGRRRSTACSSTRSRRGWCATRSASTSSSPRTSSATCSPTSPPSSRAGWGWRRARASPPAPARPRSSSPSTVPRRTSPGAGLANPLGAIWSASLMLDHLGETDAAARAAARGRSRLQGRPADARHRRRCLDFGGGGTRSPARWPGERADGLPRRDAHNARAECALGSSVRPHDEPRPAAPRRGRAGSRLRGPLAGRPRGCLFGDEERRVGARRDRAPPRRARLARPAGLWRPADVQAPPDDDRRHRE